VASVSKAGTAFVIIFGVIFAGGGMIAAGTILFGDPAKFRGNPLVGVAVCSIFIAIGAGIVRAAIFGARKLNQQAARQQANPDSPWLWREDWAISRAQSRNRNATMGLWIAAILSNAISTAVGVVALPPLLRTPDLKALVPIAFCLLGAILLVLAMRASIRRERFGNTYFEFAALPVPGNRLRGAIHLRFNTTAARGIDLRLSCVRQVVNRSGDGNTTNQILLWQDTQNVPGESVRAGPTGEACIEVDFAIPRDALETNQVSSNDQVLWILHAEAEVPGVNYSDDFEVPVFRPTPATAPVSDPGGASFGNFSSGGQFGSRSTGAATAPAFESDASDVEAPDNPTVVVSSGPNGGTEFYFPAFRNPARVLMLLLFTMVWTGVVYFLHRSTAPWFFPVVFGLFDLLLIYASIQSVLGAIRIELGSGKIAARKTLLGMGSTREIPYAEIAQILVVTGSYQGTRVKDASYSIRLLTKAGKKLTLVDAVYDRQEARWIVAQMEKLAGLKLDTHVAVDAPLVAYAGYRQPPQRGQAHPVPPAALRRGRGAAAWLGALMFAGWIAYILFRFATLPHPTPHPSSVSKASPGPISLPRVSYPPLSERDERRLGQLPAQAQAEELLERAIQHDPRALDLFEKNIGVWLGEIKLSAHMKQLEQRSQFSTDLRVRRANADLNLAMDGWAKNDQSAALMIERAQSQPGSRAQYVYFMGMLAGRGVAYDRIYPALVNYAKNDPDAGVRQWAVEGMRFLGTDEALDRLFESFTSDASASVRERAGCNLSDCGLFTRAQRMRMVPKFIALAGDAHTSPQMRRWSFMALQEITDQNLPANAPAWSAWYAQHGGEKMSQFEAQNSWQIRGDE
jgi:hypothetical protein